jgi:hypothetical protein
MAMQHLCFDAVTVFAPKIFSKKSIPFEKMSNPFLQTFLHRNQQNFSAFVCKILYRHFPFNCCNYNVPASWGNGSIRHYCFTK